jgi:UDP-N-acetylmuramate--alanine ligase
MDTKNLQNVYMLGIGGIGMSAIALYLHHKGVHVSGYDKTESPITQLLISKGIAVSYKDEIASIPSQVDLVIYTPAVPVQSVVFSYCKQHFPMEKRSAILGKITADYKTFAVAGTHGKTTVSSMLAHILHHCQIDVSAFMGGIANNFNSNLLLNNKAEYMIVEADEFDRSFLTLKPQTAIITCVDADHLDIYGNVDEFKKTFELFAQNCSKNGLLVYRSDISIALPTDIKRLSYSIVESEKADYKAVNIKVQNGALVFDLHRKSEYIKSLQLGIPGRHNIENVIAAIAACDTFNFTEVQIRSALASYTGVKRRYDVIKNGGQTIYIDDYAHHPAELNAIINSVKEIYPNKKISGIFQPHLFSRTRDFLPEFAMSLSQLDELFLLPIYPARETPIEGINSAVLLEKINCKSKKLVEKENLLENVYHLKTDVLLTLGAGDIDRFVAPIKDLLDRKEAVKC